MVGLWLRIECGFRVRVRAIRQCIDKREMRNEERKKKRKKVSDLRKRSIKLTAYLVLGFVFLKWRDNVACILYFGSQLLRNFTTKIGDYPLPDRFIY